MYNFIKLRKTKHLSDLGSGRIGKLDDDYELTSTLIIDRNLNESELKLISDEVISYCSKFDLNITSNEYILKINGKAINFSNAFNIQFVNYELDNEIYYANESTINIPNSWKDKVQHILGFDNRKIAKPHSQLRNQFVQKTIEPAEELNSFLYKLVS